MWTADQVPNGRYTPLFEFRSPVLDRAHAICEQVCTGIDIHWAWKPLDFTVKSVDIDVSRCAPAPRLFACAVAWT